jgi:hypothetical protein
MADDSTGGGDNARYFIVGGLVVAMAVGGFASNGGYLGGHVDQKTNQVCRCPLRGA